MRTNDFDYDLPTERIAQTPIEPRHASRLMVIRRDSPAIDHSTFWELDRYLRAGDLLVLNQTRVLPARIHAHKPTGGKAEMLLLKRIDPLRWTALVGGKRLKQGMILSIPGGATALIEAELEGAERVIQFSEPVENYLDSIGEMPLPPYIHTRLKDRERYQTVYASQNGSAAAPTAGLHFTPQLFEKLAAAGINCARVTLHVGLDTFAPVTVDDPTQHAIHTEWCQVSQEAADDINQTRAKGGRIIAVGTTTVRTLETAATHAQPGDAVSAWQGATSLYILPGFEFKVADAIITNFHLPHSTLLMMISAFAGRERVLAAYRLAIQEAYRFYSFGDAMLIL
ncbi:MAG: tRNA preQ1(34) S-adenosylmethionine ribosyltransferase-isomerase QueA [Anaerolineae bacterium]|nr:tRNA preQ1(34) S-adenosylmethionine ribosyltransferase-isomerase QueA [Anaerolineae bacterium]